MPMRKLRTDGDSVIITLPKGDLRRDEVLDEDGELVDDEISAAIDRDQERRYEVEIDPDRSNAAD